MHCHTRHTSHVPTWLGGKTSADWTSARGHFAPVFQNDCVQQQICVYTGLILSLLLLPPHNFLTSAVTMDVPEPDQSPFTAVSTHTSKLTRVSFWLSLEGLRSAQCLIPAHRDQVVSEDYVLMCIAVAIPSLPRRFDSLHHVSLGWIRCPAHHFLPAHRLRARMVHWYVCACPTLSMWQYTFWMGELSE